VKPGTLPAELQPPNNGADYSQNLANPPYKKIDLNGKTYQYRVILDPNPFPIDQQSSEAQKVVFELLTPDNQQPQRQTLYSVDDLKKRDLGLSLGVPRITAALNYDNRLFFSIASEQGEGASGIATIVSYDPQKNQSTIIQPEGIKRQQITDLVISGESTNPTFWMGTQISGEGNPYLPGMGLVAYRPNPQNLNSGSVKSYSVHNSPIVGVIPDKLKLENDTLWVGTGNGICQVKWQAADDPKSWSCKRFALFTKLPNEGIPLYNTLTAKNPAATLSPANSGEMVEVLWFSPLGDQVGNGRYEVRYSQGFTGTLDEQGTTVLPPDTVKIMQEIQPGRTPFYLPGSEWHWNGTRFVRGLDALALNLVGSGPSGIGSDLFNQNGVRESNTIRGDFDLLNLSQKSTSVRHYSGWVDQDKINLSLTVVDNELPENPQPNPLNSLVNQLGSQ
jgi:hypothetical protein